ncbi:thioesterase II family protein [Aeromonas piscicola]
MSDAEILTLVCFPHAGGGMGRYRTWGTQLPDGIKLALPCLPGREGRIMDEPLTDVSAVTEEVLRQLAPEINSGARLAIVGLSYGALVAYDVAARLEASGQRVEALFVASQRAPTTPALASNWCRMANDQLLAKLAAIGGLSAEVGENEEFLDLFLPIIRADLHASEIYMRPHVYAPLRCPIYLYHGCEDSAISAADTHAWRDETAQFSLRSLNCGHFLTDEGGADLWLEAVRQDLEQHVHPGLVLSY